MWGYYGQGTLRPGVPFMINLKLDISKEDYIKCINKFDKEEVKRKEGYEERTGWITVANLCLEFRCMTADDTNI